MHLEVFPVHDCSTITRFIVLGPMAEKIVVQRLLFGVVEAFEGHFGGSEVGSEEVHNLLGPVRKIKFHRPTSHLQLSTVSEALRDHGFLSPKNRGHHARWKGNVAASDDERLTDKSSRGPVAHRDQSAGTAHSK